MLLPLPLGLHQVVLVFTYLKARVLSVEETEDFYYYSSKCSRWSPLRTTSPPSMASCEMDTLIALPEGLLGREPLVRTHAQVVNLPTEPMSLPYDMHQSYICPEEEWMDQTSVELVMTTPNTVTISRSSSHTSIENGLATMGCFSDSFLRFDVAHSPQPDIFTCETPPYSSDIYADYFPGNDYDVDPNDIDTAFDCDISTLDSYLHSPSCNNAYLPHHQPRSSTPTQQSSIASIEQPAAFDKCAVEEFFPNLCQSSNASLVQQTSRRSSRSSGIVTTTTRYSPYSPSSLSPDASSDYREKRDKNNIASKRSRQKRAEKQREMRNEKEILERRNIELRTLLGSLEVQVADYKHIVLMMMSKLRS